MTYMLFSWISTRKFHVPVFSLEIHEKTKSPYSTEIQLICKPPMMVWSLASPRYDTVDMGEGSKSGNGHQEIQTYIGARGLRRCMRIGRIKEDGTNGYF